MQEAMQDQKVMTPQAFHDKVVALGSMERVFDILFGSCASVVYSVFDYSYNKQDSKDIWVPMPFGTRLNKKDYFLILTSFNKQYVDLLMPEGVNLVDIDSDMSIGDRIFVDINNVSLKVVENYPLSVMPSNVEKIRLESLPPSLREKYESIKGFKNTKFGPEFYTRGKNLDDIVGGKYKSVFRDKNSEKK